MLKKLSQWKGQCKIRINITTQLAKLNPSKEHLNWIATEMQEITLVESTQASPIFLCDIAQTLNLKNQAYAPYMLHRSTPQYANLECDENSWMCVEYYFNLVEFEYCDRGGQCQICCKCV